MSSVSLTGMTCSGWRASTAMKRKPARATSGVPCVSGGTFNDAIAVSRAWISGSSGMSPSSPRPVGHLLGGLLAGGPPPAAQGDGRDENREQREQQHARDDH